MVQAAPYPPLQRTQGRGTHSSGTGKKNTEGRATRPNLRIVPVNAFNHDRAGHAIEILTSAFLVRVRVIPIQPGRRIEWNINSIVQHFPWHRHHCQDIILRILGRNVQAVKMQIAHVLAERERAFLV
jgi:hypothetical protein